MATGVRVSRWSPRVKALLSRVRMAGPAQHTYYRMDIRALLIRDACARLESARAASQLGDHARAARWLDEAAAIRRQIPASGER